MSVAPKHILFTALKLAVTLGLLYYVLSGLTLQRLSEIVRTVPPLFVGLAIVLHICAFVIGGIRWWLLARSAGVLHTFPAVLPSYYLGVFSNNFLPTGVGGDIVRMLHLRTRNVSWQSLLASTIGDRLMGLVVLFATGLVAMATLDNLPLDITTRAGLLTLAMFVVASIGLFMTDWFGRLISGLTKRYDRTRVRKTVLDVVHSLHRLREQPRLLLFTLGLSLLMQFLVIITYYALARGMGLDQPLHLYFAIVPIVFLAATIPISIGGLGVRESSLVGLLVLFGASRDNAVGLSLVYLLVLWCASLPGLITLWLPSAREKQGHTQA